LMKCITLDVIGKTAFGYDFSCSGTLTPSPVAVAFEFMLEVGDTSPAPCCYQRRGGSRLLLVLSRVVWYGGRKA